MWEQKIAISPFQRPRPAQRRKAVSFPVEGAGGASWPPGPWALSSGGDLRRKGTPQGRKQTGELCPVTYGGPQQVLTLGVCLRWEVQAQEKPLLMNSVKETVSLPPALSCRVLLEPQRSVAGKENTDGGRHLALRNECISLGLGV